MDKCSGPCGLVLFESALYTCAHCSTSMCLTCTVAHLKTIKFNLVTVPKMVKESK